MTKKYTRSFIRFFCWSCLLLGSLTKLNAQTVVATKCYTPPANTAEFDNNFGAVVGGVNFVPGVDIPPGYRIADIEIQITWSKTLGTCASPAAGAVDVSEVGFALQDPTGGTTYFAPSNTFAAFIPAPSGTFAGTGQVLNITTNFRASQLTNPAAFPMPAAPGTYRSNGPQSLSSFIGTSPFGGTDWALVAIDDAPIGTGFLCIQSYCVKIYACPGNPVDAICKTGTITLPLASNGIRTMAFADLNNGSDTSCMLRSVVFTPNSFACTAVGQPATTVKMVITDMLGSRDSCTSNVVITDTIAPNIICKNYTLKINNLGVASMNANDSIIASDACGMHPTTPRRFQFITGIGGSPIGGQMSTLTVGCGSIGTIPLRLIATDVNNNVRTCDVNLTTLDTIPPTAICKTTVTAYLNSSAPGTGNVTVNAFDLDNGSTEVCPPIGSYQINGGSSQNYTCANLGNNSATLAVFDIRGNFSTCTATVSVVDTVRPQAICQNINAYVASNGSVTIPASAINNASIDNCTTSGLLNLQINGAATATYTCANIGTPLTATLTVRDASNNTATCSSTITVLDTLRPTALCRNTTAYVNASGSVTVLPSAINNASFDNCTASASLIYRLNGSITGATYDCSHISVSQVAVLSITDASGNAATCTGNVTILDTFPPVARCQTTTAYLGANGTVSVPATAIDNATTPSSDNCAITNRLINGNPTTVYNCGQVNTNPSATLRVLDFSGNFNECLATVQVRDTVRPIARCRNRVINLTGTSVVVFPSDIDDNITPSSDNCGSLSYLINGQSAVTYTCGNTGGNSVVLTVTDASGNIGTCTATITVQDASAPVAICRNTTVFVNPGNTVSVLPSEIRNAASNDNCGITTARINGANSINYTCDSLVGLVGVRTAILTLSDAAGNASTCNAQITVRDTTPPLAFCNNRTVQLGATGTVTVFPNTGAARINNNSTDNCGIAGYKLNGLDSVVYTCAAVGTPQTAVLSVTDGSGNVATCNATINVQDLTLPTAICRINPVVYLNGTGNGSLTAVALDSASADNCGITNRTINGVAAQSYTCADLGSNSATLVVSDAAGGSANCAATVVVRDTIRPTVTCNAVTNVYLPSPSGTVSVTPLQIGSASDVCGISSRLINGLASQTYSCSAVGTPQTAVLSVTDASGNSRTCNATVNVLDTVSPVARCQNVTLSLSSVAVNGDTTVTPFIVDNGSTDNCSITVRSINNQPTRTFNCSHIALNPNPVTIRVQDAQGNNSVCNATVTVIDTRPPTAVCQNITRIIGAGGFVVISPADIDGGSTDNCTITNRTISKDTFRCADIGANNVSFRVFDASGNVDSCQAVVTIQDNVAPIARCSSVVNAYLSSACLVSVSANQVDSLSSDNCGISTRFINGGTSQSYSAVGANPVTLVITDFSGNTASCASVIQVRDTIRPAITCTNASRALGATGTTTVTPASLVTVTDNCSAITLTINNQPTAIFNCTNTGANPVIIRATDASGNTATCAATVTITDNTAPTALCQNITVTLSAAGVTSITPSQINASSTDNCSITSYSISRDTFRCADVPATQNVVLTVRDASNNTATCTSVVTVRDAIRPTAICKLDTAYIGTSGFVDEFPADIDNNSFDNCAIISRTINGKPSQRYTCADIGLRNAQLEVYDGSNNMDSCQTTVLVRDTIRPVITCAPITRQLNVVGQITVGAGELATVTDNCGVILLIGGAVNRVFDCTNRGNNNVTVTARDSAGNTSTCVAVLTIQDVTPPTAQCQNMTITLGSAPNGVTNVPAAQIAALSNDACGIMSYTSSPLTVSCASIGIVPVTITVRDSSNNASTCSANITVRDSVAPTMVCRPDTAYLSSTINAGIVSVNATDIDGGTTDNCGLNSLLINGSSNVLFNCSNIGLVTVTLSASDIYGNVGTCQTTVLVRDTVRPLARCSTQITVQLNPAGVAVVSPAQVDSLSRDNCALNVSTSRINGQSAVTYTCASTGAPQFVTLSVLDNSGNSSTCPSSVIIQDTVRPVATCVGSPVNVNLSPNVGAGSVTITPATINNGSTDNCGISSLLVNGQPNFVYTCANRGANVATLRVTDNSNNQSTCTVTVNVNDITPPTARCVFSRTVTLASVNNGLVRLPATILDNGSTDNCGVVSWQIGGQDSVSFDCSQANTNIPVTLTVRDAANNPSSCSGVIFVVDTVRPIARCSSTPVNVYLGANCTSTVTGAMIDAGSTDNCGIVSRLIGGATSRQYTSANIATNPNPTTLTVADASGNTATCNVQLNVQDTMSPVASCQNRSLVLSGNPAMVVVNAASINLNSTDNCGIANFLINGQARDTFDCSNVGTQNAVLTVIDNSGNAATCIASLTITDNTNPVINCQQNVSIFLTANPGGNVQVLPTQVASGTDGCGIIFWSINGQPSANYNCDSAAVNNPHPALIRATDPSGNFSTCIATLNVIDTVRPVALCRNITVQLTAAGTVSVPATQINNSSTDNCQISTLLINNQNAVNYTCANVGSNNFATLIVRDPSGNQSTCSTTITVQDNIPPTANCRSGITVSLDAVSGIAIVQATAINGTPSSTDACGPLTYLVGAYAQDTFDCTNLGTNPVILTVQDANGNAAQCASLITVLDATPPIARCRNATVYLDNNGFGQLTPPMINNGSTDNCRISSYRIDNQTALNYTCANAGLDTVTLLVTDPSGNTSTCTSVITIQDTVAPIVVCQAVTVNLTTTGQAILTPAMLDPNNGSSDACGIDTMFVSPDTLTCNNHGILQAVLTVIDINGNIGRCTTTVTANLDSPVASSNSPICEGDTIMLMSTRPANGNNYNFTWTSNSTTVFSSTTQNPSILNASADNTGTYIVQIQPTNGGCIASDTIEVRVNIVIPPTMVADTPTCENDQTILSISNMSAYTGTNFNFQWRQNGTPVGVSNDSLVISTTTLANAGNYSVRIEVDGCPDSSTTDLNLVVHPLPPMPMPTANTPCEGENLQLTANPQDNRPYTYQWAGACNQTAAQANPVFFDILQICSGTYSVTVTDNFGCTATNSVSVTVAPAPIQPNIFYNSPLCGGVDLLLQDTTIFPIQPVTYRWTLPDSSFIPTTTNTLTLPSAQAGLYGLRVDMNGCLSLMDTIMVNYEPIPVAQNDSATVAFRDSLVGVNVVLNDVYTGFTLSIVDSANHGRAYVRANGLIDYVPAYSFFGKDTIVYQICDASCGLSCDTALLVIDVTTDFECYIPNAISPNGDGINDVLNIRCLHEYPNRQMYIYSRWGNLVYQGNGTDFNGQFNGQELPDGTYYFVFKLNSTQYVANDELKGYIILNR